MSAPPEKQSGPGPNNTGDLASRASQRQASILRSDAETRDLVLLKKWPVVPPGGDYTALHCFLVLYQNLLRMVLRRGAKVDSIEKIAESFFSEELVLWKEFCKPLESRNWLWEKLESTANSIVKPDGPVRFVQMMDKVWTQLWQHDYLRLYTTELKKPGQELTPLPLDAGHYSWNALRWNGIEDIGSSIERVFSYNTTPIPGSDDLMVINQKFPAVLTISYKSEHPVPDIWERAQGLPRLFNYRQIPLLHDTTSWRWCPTDLIRVYHDHYGEMVQPLEGEIHTQPWSLSDAGSEFCLFYHRVPLDKPYTPATEQRARRYLPIFRASHTAAQESTAAAPSRVSTAPAPASAPARDSLPAPREYPVEHQPSRKDGGNPGVFTFSRAPPLGENGDGGGHVDNEGNGRNGGIPGLFASWKSSGLFDDGGSE